MGLLRYLQKKKFFEAHHKHHHFLHHHHHEGHEGSSRGHRSGSSHSHDSSHGSSQSRDSSHGSAHTRDSSHSRLSAQGSSHGSSSVGSSKASIASSRIPDYGDIDFSHVKEAFKIIDTDNDGKISKLELGVMWNQLGEDISEEELRFMIQDADADGDGLIDYDEFVLLHKIMSAKDNEVDVLDIKMAFSVADIDRNGNISALELQRVMKQLGARKISLEECIDMCRIVDADGDGNISYEEFERLMRSNLIADATA